MSEDLVQRLRDAAALPTGLYAEAADEIERLRACLTPFGIPRAQAADTALLKQAREALTELTYKRSKTAEHLTQKAIAALRERLK